MSTPTALSEMVAEMGSRYRMALAEGGFPDESAAVALRDGQMVVFGAGRDYLPKEVRWRARETAGLNLPRCWACCEGWRSVTFNNPDCRAMRRFERDCGVGR